MIEKDINSESWIKDLSDNFSKIYMHYKSPFGFRSLGGDKIYFNFDRGEDYMYINDQPVFTIWDNKIKIEKGFEIDFIKRVAAVLAEISAPIKKDIDKKEAEKRQREREEARSAEYIFDHCREDFTKFDAYSVRRSFK